mgnify:CR=1 FL=1
MKRKWSLRLGAAVLCAVLLGSCGSTAAAPAESTAPADPLTGQQLLYPEQRAAAVVIENTTGSTTQWGIGSASVVLEALTESGSSTELCLVYPALSAMPVVGPVTRGQDLYWRLLSGQQVLPIQRGCDLYTRNFLDYWNLRAVDALETGRNAFTTGNTDWASPLWCTNGQSVAKVLSSLSLSSALSEDPAESADSTQEEDTPAVPTVPALLPQQTDGHLPDADAADAVQAAVQFPSGSTTRFAYDTDTGTYGMLHNDGSPQLDANTGIQAAFDNLLVLYSASTPRDDGRTLDYDLTMGGGLWLNGGHLWHITWTQGTGSTFAFYDADGRPLRILSGRSYIAWLSSLTGEEVTVQDSAGNDLLQP